MEDELNNQATPNSPEPVTPTNTPDPTSLTDTSEAEAPAAPVQAQTQAQPQPKAQPAAQPVAAHEPVVPQVQQPVQKPAIGPTQSRHLVVHSRELEGGGNVATYDTDEDFALAKKADPDLKEVNLGSNQLLAELPDGAVMTLDANEWGALQKAYPEAKVLAGTVPKPRTGWGIGGAPLFSSEEWESQPMTRLLGGLDGAMKSNVVERLTGHKPSEILGLDANYNRNREVVNDPNATKWQQAGASAADLARFVGRLADFAGTPEGLINSVATILSGGATVPIQSGLYGTAAGAQTIQAAKEYIDNRNPDTLQNLLESTGMTMLLLTGSAKEAGRAPTWEEGVAKTRATLGAVAKGAGVAIEKPRVAIADALKSARENKEANIAQRQQAEIVREAARKEGSGAVDTAKNHNLMADEEYNTAKKLGPKEQGEAVARKMRDDAMRNVARDDEVTTKAHEDGKAVRSKLNQIVEERSKNVTKNGTVDEDERATLDKVTSDPVIKEVMNAPNDAKAASIIRKSLGSNTLEMLHDAGHGDLADEMVKTAENYAWRDAARAPEGKWLDAISKHYDQMGDNGVGDFSDKFGEHAETVRDLSDLRDTVERLQKVAPEANWLQKIGGAIKDRGLRSAAYQILGGLLGFKEFGVGGGLAAAATWGAGKWVLSRTPVIRGLIKVASLLEDGIRPGGEGKAAVIPDAKPIDIKETPLAEEKTAQSTEAHDPKKEELIEQGMHNQEHADLAKPLGLKYGGTSEGLVYYTDPKSGSTYTVNENEGPITADRIKSRVDEGRSRYEAAKEGKPEPAKLESPEEPTHGEQAEVIGGGGEERIKSPEEIRAGEEEANENLQKEVAAGQHPEIAAQAKEREAYEARQRGEVPTPKTEEEYSTQMPQPKETPDNTARREENPEKPVGKADLLEAEAKKQFGEKATYWSLDEDQQRKVVDAVDKANKETAPVPAAKEIGHEPTVGEGLDYSKSTTAEQYYARNYINTHKGMRDSMTLREILNTSPRFNPEYGKGAFVSQHFGTKEEAQDWIKENPKYKNAELVHTWNDHWVARMPSKIVNDIVDAYDKANPDNKLDNRGKVTAWAKNNNIDPNWIDEVPTSLLDEARKFGSLAGAEGARGLRNAINHVIKFFHEGGHAISAKEAGILSDKGIEFTDTGARLHIDLSKLAQGGDMPIEDFDGLMKHLASADPKVQQQLLRMFAAGRGMEEAVGMGAGSPHNADPTVRFSDRWKSDRLNEAIGVPKDQWDKVWNDNVAERQAHVESNPQYIEELRGVLQKHLSDDNLNVPGKELHDAIDRATGKEIQPEKPVVERIPVRRRPRKSENNTVDKRAAAMGLTNKP